MIPSQGLVDRIKLMEVIYKQASCIFKIKLKRLIMLFFELTSKINWVTKVRCMISRIEKRYLQTPAAIDLYFLKLYEG